MVTLTLVLDRSEELDDRVFSILDPETYELHDDSARLALALAACEISIDHARALRTLVRAGLMTSAVGLMRPQWEAFVRAMWLLYAATEEHVGKLAAPLNLESEKIANKLPMLSEMIAAINGKAPATAVSMISHFKEVQTPALNSFVHGGLHPLKRHFTGYTEPLLVQIVSTSNGLVTMAGMTMALLSGDPELAKAMSKIQRDFADCLPPMLPHA